jgi:hypothetical protein
MDLCLRNAATSGTGCNLQLCTLRCCAPHHAVAAALTPPMPALQSVAAGNAAAKAVQAGVGAGRDVESPEVYIKVKEAVQTKVLETFAAPLTRVIKFTGPAMAPLLNRHCTKDPASHEFLLTHRITAPSPTNVLKGDVVAFKHPLGGVEPSALMVRRVTAQGGELLESETAQHTLAPDTVWVTAENSDLEPPDVEDSRTFGPVQLDAIVGRCIYAIRSKADREHIDNNKVRASYG